MNPIEAGRKAPAFSLVDQEGRTHRLKDYAGKRLVLYFYPKALTPGCTTQACGLRDSQSELEALNAVAVGISPDAPGRLEKFRHKHALNFDLLSDEEHRIADKYGVWGPKKFMGREYDGIHRVTFIIDESSRIAHVIDKVKTKTHHEQVISLLKGE